MGIAAVGWGAWWGGGRARLKGALVDDLSVGTLGEEFLLGEALLLLLPLLALLLRWQPQGDDTTASGQGARGGGGTLRCRFSASSSSRHSLS
jgi:hypothetical protein